MFIRIFVLYLSYIVSTKVVVFDKNVVVLIYVSVGVNVSTGHFVS